jgi:transposase, IS5 family
MTRKIHAASSSPARSAAPSVSSSASCAVEPVIGHLKAEGHLGRCYLKGRAGDAAKVILSAIGHNFRRILAWLRNLLRLILVTLIAAARDRSSLESAS